MMMLRSILLPLALFLGLSTSGARAAEVPPDMLARTTTQEVLTILKQEKELTPAKVHQLVEAKVLPIFDFNRMTQLAVGKHWPGATPQQKQALVTEFRNLLVRTYSSSLTEFSNQAVEFKPMTVKPDATDVTVRSEIRQPGSQPVPVDYSMYKTDFGWKVYDVAIDGVSLVTNYRASFSSTIRQSGIDGLIALLAAKSPQSPAKPARPKS